MHLQVAICSASPMGTDLIFVSMTSYTFASVFSDCGSELSCALVLIEVTV